MKFPREQEPLRRLVSNYRRNLEKLAARTRAGDGGAYKSLKIMRRKYNALLKELKREYRRSRDNAWLDFLERLLGDRLD